ncbi:MAG: MarR family transcriptional regulator [Streptosporangiales bacterium]|nr:MarR family transcriptional regulator [Streptosporangiales bacterium]
MADLLCLLTRASHVLATQVAAALADLGVSQRAYGVLSNAMEAELTQIRLAEVCSLDKTTMVAAVDELERAGLAERRASSTDRRAHVVAVTLKGRRLVAKAGRVVDQLYEDVLGTLPARERTAFVDALTRLNEEGLASPAPCKQVRRPRAAKAS